MATTPCSTVNSSGGPQGKGRPLPKKPLPKSPGACSSPSLGRR